MPPSGFFIGPLYIRFYGILIMLGAIAAAFLAEREARRRKLDSEFVWDALILVLIGGIIGARLWHVFTPPPSMLVLDPATGQYVNPYFINGTPQILDILSIWRGGLGIPGAIIGGALALFFYCRHRKMSFAMWADIAVPGVALAQAIGRWGNFFNQELYGKPSTLPWAIYIDPVNRVPGYTQFSTFQPLFLYESLWNLLNMGLLLFLERRIPDKLRNGVLMLIYLIGYPFGRFWLEFIKLDSPRAGTININQTVMLVVLVLSAALLIWRHRKGASPKEGAEAVEPGASPEQPES
jgi:phosphatidylglycerol:prolipoprotein diacylglycerol transferase